MLKVWVIVLLLLGVVWFVDVVLVMYFYGKVIYVDDGDMLIFFIEGYSKVNVCFMDIDVFELVYGKGRLGQFFSQNFKVLFFQFVYGKQVDVDCYEMDCYQCQVCCVFVDGLDVNLEQVRCGMVWVN